MANKILSRVARLEAKLQERARTVVEHGFVKRLPADYIGERHIVVTKRYPSENPEWQTCDFEERPGPGPDDQNNTAQRLYFEEEYRGIL